MKEPYKVTQPIMRPIEKMLEALIEVNAWRVHAESEGWLVEFVVNENDVDVQINRNQWPTFHDDQAQE